MTRIVAWLMRWWDLLVLHVMGVFILVLISLCPLLTRKRMSHQNGIVARGRNSGIEVPHEYLAPTLLYPSVEI